MKFIAILAAFSAATLVASQGITQCVITCSSQAAAAAGCSSYLDVSCVCTSAAFQNAAGACLAANCTTDEQSMASSLQSAACQGQSVTSGTVTQTIAMGTSSIDLSSIAGGLTQSASGGSASAASATSAVATSAASGGGQSSSGGGGQSSSGGASSASSAAATTSGGAGKIEIVGLKGLAGIIMGFVGVLGGAAIVL